jgi:hypothetical protein
MGPYKLSPLLHPDEINPVIGRFWTNYVVLMSFLLYSSFKELTVD